MPNYELKNLLKYNNQRVIVRFSKEFGCTVHSSKQIFQDMLLFLWLSERARKKSAVAGIPKNFGLLPIWMPIDHMWHTFILFTRDYTQFSKQYFKRFVHHFPGDPTTKNEALLSSSEIEKYMEFVYDELGEKIFLRWFKIYPKLSRLAAFRKKTLKKERALFLGET